jgi:hypothetical protein
MFKKEKSEMGRVCFEAKNCTVAKSKGVSGDGWSILVVLEAM